MRWSDPGNADPVMLAGVVAAGAVLAMLGSLWAIRHAGRNNLIDQPGERRSHAEPTPRGGGIGIVVACLVMLLGLAGIGSPRAAWLLVAAGLALVAAIGWWDDHRPLPAWPRLGVHGIAAGLLALALHLGGAQWPAVAAAFVLALVLVNAWNFMDGINGLAASQALLCAAGFALVLGDGWRVLAMATAGACLGFLPFNSPRAKVFLGDVGSGALGYLMAALLAAAFGDRTMAWWPALLLPPAAMLADAGLTLASRARRGDRWWQAHVQHAFQRWSRHSGHSRVCVAYALWTFAAVAIMLAALHGPAHLALGTALAGLLASACAWGWLHRRYAKNKTEGFGA